MNTVKDKLMSILKEIDPTLADLLARRDVWVKNKNDKVVLEDTKDPYFCIEIGAGKKLHVEYMAWGSGYIKLSMSNMNDDKIHESYLDKHTFRLLVKQLQDIENIL